MVPQGQPVRTAQKAVTKGSQLVRQFESSHDMPIPPVFGGAESSESAGRHANSDSDEGVERPRKCAKVAGDPHLNGKAAGKGGRRGKGFRLPRYTGILKRFNPQLGGFMISSPELRALYQCDVVVNREELPPDSYSGVKLSFVACEEESVKNPVAHQLEKVICEETT
eukprot:GEMP01025500.1.p1 GENE.GEMP01025500.1~~GEMP01025500.1.p1  ORF type:complete len:167 (+),score=27.99 GEMP01025500.1:1-501(+)